MCPAVLENLRLDVDKEYETIRFAWKTIMTDQDILTTVRKAQLSYQGLQHLAFNFRSKFEHMTNQIQEIGTKIVFQQDSIAKETKKSLKAITDLTETGVNTLKDKTEENRRYFSDAEFTSFKAKVAEAIKDNMKELETHLSNSKNSFVSFCDEKILECTAAGNNTKKTIEKTSTDFAAWLDNKTREIEKLLAAKPAIHSAQSSVTNSTTPLWMQKPERQSKLFPNVNVEHIWNKSLPTMDAKQNEYNEQDTEPDTSTDDWSYLGPSQDTSTTITHLPPLLPGKMYSQVKIPYEGKDASFAWYRQLRSAVFQYGILLKPCEEFQRGKSLCPNKYGTITVTAVRYNEMKGPLYQLLQSPDIVPMTFEDIRGIITKNGAWGDGYRTLYEIMSRIHPILNPDAQLPPPHSGNFVDIHGYYNQFDAYVLHQKLLYGISMTKRQKVIQFLAGLDESYQRAIDQIKQHMMNWRQDDPNPPEALEITELPHTIEHIMQHYGETPIIRAMTQGKHTSPSRNKFPNSSKPDLTQGKLSLPNVQCTYCKMIGHKRATCHKMALWLILQDHAARMDDKFKTQITQEYRKTMDDKQRSKLTKFQGTVRQLYINGEIDRAEEVLADMFLQLDNTQMVCESDDEEEQLQNNDS
jgi:hypothetical protein